MSLLKYATPPVLPGSASNRVHPVALALNPKAIFLTPPFLPASAQSVCQSVGSAFQNVESSLLWLGQLPWFTPPSSFPWGTMVVPDPSCLLEFAEQLERSFNRISLLHGILFKGSRLLTLFCEVLCFLTPADLSISFPISFLLFNFPDLLVNPELGAHSCLRDFIIHCSCCLEKHCSDLCRSVPLCQYVFCSDVYH